ncbi:LPS translocon maturation chaperone LptM [Serpentinimonas barnesii]|uniref:LPS translocon maturation chaperone LptM n=1 Tax=Serpentinimonas barnesii TaxID=1458427 RepID=UPI0011EA7037
MHDSDGIVGLRPLSRVGVPHPASWASWGAAKAGVRVLGLSLCLCMVLLSLAGCGQKGPLFLPSSTVAGTST